jgi:tetratricopeptide (TPR) repeat protein
MADIVWLQTIQYFGAGTPYGKYKSLGSLLDTITQLDPKFEYPYEFGLVVLPFMDQTDMAIKLGERAQKEIPNNGLLSYYLASDYHLYKKDYAKAAKYYQLASTQPGSPTAAKTLAATALGQVDNSIDDRLVAAEFWKTVFDSTSDPDRKELAARWYKQMQDIYAIEKAAIAYKAKTGSFPHTQTDLVQAGFIASEFVSPVGRELKLDPATGKVNFDNLLPQQ